MTDRPSRQARGYGAKHDKLRRKYQRRMDHGEVFVCPRCNQPVDPTDWDLGHADDRTAYHGPEHPACNRSAGGKAAAAARPSRQRPSTRHPGLIDDDGGGRGGRATKGPRTLGFSASRSLRVMDFGVRTGYGSPVR